MLNDELTALGQNGGISSGPPGSGSVCTGGTYTLTELLLVLPIIGLGPANFVPTYISVSDLGSGGRAVESNLLAVLTNARVPYPSIVGGWRYDDLGTPIGAFVVGNPGGGFPSFYGLVPSGIAGVAAVCQPPGC